MQCIHLLEKNDYVLFLHHSGAAGAHWQKFKERIRLDFPLHSLLLPSKISRYTGLEKHKNISPGNCNSPDPKGLLKAGGALLVACSSLSQVSAVLEKCCPPDFLCIGGSFPGMPFLSYLDIQRWVLLHKKSEQVYGSLLAQLAHWQRFPLLLENHLERAQGVKWTSWSIKKKLVNLLEIQCKRKSPPSGPMGAHPAESSP